MVRRRFARRLLPAILVSLAVAGSVVVPALPAGADAGNITFNSVSGDGSGNLAVTITSDIPLSGITVHLMSGPTDVLDLTDFTEQGTFVDGTTPQTWTLNNAGTNLATLAPGTYTATMDAADTDTPPDQTASGLTPASGTFNFLIAPSISLSQDTVTSSAPGQDVNIAGQLTAVQPLASSATPWAGQTVTITDASNTTWTGTSQADGSFKISVTGVPNDTYTASVLSTPVSLTATSPTSTTDVPQYATTSITATATPAPYGQQSITGTVTYQSGLNQVNAPGGVQITASAPGQQPIPPTTTNANGGFSIMLPPVTGTTTWTLTSQADLASTPFLAGTTTSISATQTWPATLGGFKVTLSRFYVLTVGGCLSSSLPPTPPADFPTIKIQYELTTAGPWRDLGTVSTTHMTGCTGAAFLARGGAPAASAYYRALFTGDNTYQPATSARVRAALIATRFSSFQVSARWLASTARKLTVSGTLQYKGALRWRAYALQRVLLIYSKNNKTWYAYHWVRTNTKGAFSLTFADSIGTAWWSANYNGNATHLVAGAPEIKVTVRRAAATALAATASKPQAVAPLFADMPGTPGWYLHGGLPFVLAPDPLLILMGPQS